MLRRSHFGIGGGDVSEAPEFALSFSREGEAIIQFTDGMRYPTGLFPSVQERDIAKPFFESTFGRTLILNLRTHGIYCELTKLLLQKPARDIIRRTLERLNGMRFEGVISVLMLDLDHFGEVNKHFGNPGGDQILHEFAEILRRNTRGGDILARWGGEEFLVLAAANKPIDVPKSEEKFVIVATSKPVLDHPGQRERDRVYVEPDRIETGTTLMDIGRIYHNGETIADRIRKATEETPFLIGCKQVRQTVTIGVANCYIEPDSNIDDLFETLLVEANEVLYRAKREDARNRVHAAPTRFSTT